MESFTENIGLLNPEFVHTRNLLRYISGYMFLTGKAGFGNGAPDAFEALTDLCEGINLIEDEDRFESKLQNSATK